MRLQFLGSGDAFGSGGRFNTCFHLTRAEHGHVLIDCGASSMVAIRKWGVDPNAVSTVLVSHLHGDHFGGLPFFLVDAQLVSRRAAHAGGSARLHRPPDDGDGGDVRRLDQGRAQVRAGNPRT